MLEIVFSDSAAGSLKCAQGYGKGKYPGSCLSVYIRHPDGRRATEEELEEAKRRAEERERLAWEKAVPMGGSSADVFGCCLSLSIGDISEDGFWEKRRQVLECLYGSYGKDGSQAVLDTITCAREGLERVFGRAEKGEDIRIWYSSQPDELCGLYWFMMQLCQLKDYSGQIYLVKMPEWEVTEEEGKPSVVRRMNWGEVAAEEWNRYLSWQKPIPTVLCRSFAADWRELQKENYPLRAEINGRLVSAPENLYDEVIIREIASEENEFHEARLIGRILGKYRLGIGDGFIALRLEKMIADGTLEIVSEAEEGAARYCRLLRKVCSNLRV